MMSSASEGTLRTSAMVMFIILGAYFINFALTKNGLTQQLNDSVAHLGWPPYWTLMAIIVFYIFLGFSMETLALMVTTILIVAPIVFSFGYDPVWFGIVLIVFD